MPTHNSLPPENNKQPGYETSDANFRGILTFMIVLGSSLAVFFVICFGLGKLINEALIRHDGPENPRSIQAGVQRANLTSDPAIRQQQLRDLVAQFPSPRLQTDNGIMDIIQMHAREDLLLDHYTWIDEKAQTVRIPITRAMQILAQQGLPVVGSTAADSAVVHPDDKQVARTSAAQPAMVGDADTSVTMPLTDGFARTGPELIEIKEIHQRMEMEQPEPSSK